jgi:hypothetical protein
MNFKHPSLQRYGTAYGRKKFYDTGPRVLLMKQQILARGYTIEVVLK